MVKVTGKDGDILIGTRDVFYMDKPLDSLHTPPSRLACSLSLSVSVHLFPADVAVVGLFECFGFALAGFGGRSLR